jgi:hypothetical protein
MLVLVLILFMCMCCISSGTLAVVQYNTEPRVKSWVDINIFGSKGVWEPPTEEQQEEIEALQVINMQVCDDKYGKDYDYSDLGSIGGDTPEEARDNGMKRVCAAASTNTYIDLNRDVCRDRAHENMLFNWQGRVDTIEPYVDAMKETCKSVLPVDNYA